MLRQKNRGNESEVNQVVVLTIIIFILIPLWAFTHALGEEGNKLETGIVATLVVIMLIAVLVMYFTS